MVAYINQCFSLLLILLAWLEVTAGHKIVAKVRRGQGLGGAALGLVTWPVLLLTRS